ncbi:hypothetical protein GCM10007859_10630 [Brevundimonas denitrificans]|uniref:TraB/GumN family protein n=1 Tax=Brevundimonas denitrificans TaxID=1443434 RepID=A0ABQ6BME5_9CAUL|nr:DUF5694 domain-containing protein [Brevundimonas denitrificans]GLS01053.1 hypothetical protein GCM10007859_10630 [Brevundimonas denitrificans]
MSHRLLFALALSVLAAAPAVAQEPAPASQPVRLLSERRIEERPALMVLGTAHLANNNRDVLRTEVDDVMSATRQAEIEAVVESLARWRPTRIAVEIDTTGQARLDRRYADYRAGAYALTASEIDQIGLRLAARLGHDRVYAVDWNDMPPGEEADYNWIEGAEAAGEQARLAELRNPVRGQRTTDLVRSRPIPEWLALMNSPEYLLVMHRPYYDFALLGGSATNQGANWVGAWHGRNLKIFANLVRLADDPGERVLVIYGAGHAFLLNRFAEESGAFNVERPGGWLTPSAP